MAIIHAMSREPDMANRIQFSSIPELKDGVETVAIRVARNLKFRGRKLRPGPMLNAVVAEFLRLPEDEQESLVESGLLLLETLLESDEPRDDLVAPAPKRASARRPLRHLSTTIVPIEITVDDDDDEDEPSEPNEKAAKGRKRRAAKKGRES